MLPPSTVTLTISWSSRGSALRNASAPRMLSPSDLDLQKKQSRTACLDSLTDCHVACTGAEHVKDSCLYQACSRASAPRVTCEPT